MYVCTYRHANAGERNVLYANLNWKKIENAWPEINLKYLAPNKT